MLLLVIPLYVILAVLIIRSLLLLGANIYRAGQSNTAPPPLMALPHLPRFGVAQGNGRAQRSEADKLPDV